LLAMFVSEPHLNRPSLPRVGITGGIGEGKSTLLAMIAAEGYEVASADAIARELFSDPEVNAQLAEIAGLHGAISPKELREAIGRSTDVRRRINRLMHPLVLGRITTGTARFVEVPLLVETCMQGYFDRIWVVTCGVIEQRKRLLERYGDPNTVSALLSAQLPTNAKIPFADSIFRTNSPVHHVKRSLSEALAGLQV